MSSTGQRAFSAAAQQMQEARRPWHGSSAKMLRAGPLAPVPCQGLPHLLGSARPAGREPGVIMLRGSREDDRSRLVSLRADPGLWRGRARLWRADAADGPGGGGRQSADARDRRGDSGRCDGLPEPAVHDHCRRRHRDLHPTLDRPGLPCRPRLPDRCGALGCYRLYRHERLGAGQCAHRRGRQARPGAGAGRGLSRRRGHRHAGGGAGPAGRLLLLRRALCLLCRRHRPRDPRHAGGPARAQLRRVPDLDLRPARWRHLHQGRRRRRRPGRQDRGRHSRG